MRWRALVLVAPVALAALAAFAACTNSEPGPYRPALPPDAAGPVGEGRPGDVGRFLYLRDCAWCHGASAKGTARAPNLHTGNKGPAAVDFVLRTRRMPLRDSDDPMRRGAATTVYSAAERRAIVDYLRTLGQAGPDIPPVAAAPRPPARGAELYLANCAACHSATGIGGTLSAARPGVGGPETSAPALTSSSPVEVAEAIRIGPGTMPVFGPESLSRNDVDAIAAYVQYLRKPDDRGGFATGRIGPVSEGAVGWILGLGTLVAVCRWIGTRTGEEGGGDQSDETEPAADSRPTDAEEHR